MNYYTPYQQPQMPYPSPMDQLAQLRQQAMQPQYPAQMQQPQMQNGMLWVKDYDEACRMQVPPGVPMWDQNKPYVYQKEVDGSGRAKTKRIRLVVEDEVPQEPEFVTWEKFNGLAENVTALANYVKSMNQKEEKNNG